MSRQLLITDCWGQHASLDPFIAGLGQAVGQFDILDPYSGQRFAFDDHEHAYGYYLRRCSQATYQQKIQSWVFNEAEPVNLIAFGAGADALWPLLSGPMASKVNKAILIEGHPTLNQTELTPACPVSLLLNRELVNIEDITNQLAQFANIRLTELPLGFTNPRSPNYDPAGAADAENWLVEQLKSGT